MAERLYLQIRSMGLFFFLPFIGYFFFLPFCIKMLNLSLEEAEERVQMARMLCYQFVPILSVVWTCMFHKEYVEGEGREVLILGKGVCGLTFLFWLVNLPCFFIFYLLPDLNAGQASDLFNEMMVVSFVLCGLVFFLNFTLNSISLSALVVMFYVMLSNVDITHFINLDETEKQQELAGYFYTVLSGKGVASEEIKWYLVAGVLFWLFGLWRARRLWG